MDPKMWSEAVRFEIEPGIVETVDSTESAITFLINRWPVEDGQRHLEARQTCLDVLSGLTRPEKAREAFVFALGEAGMATVP